MTTLHLLFAVLGLTILLVAIVGAIRNRDNDRWAEGLLIGIYVGALGSISLLAILVYFGVLVSLWRGSEDESINVRSRHLTDVRLALMNVRFEGNNGHDADVTRCLLLTQSGRCAGGLRPLGVSQLRRVT